MHSYRIATALSLVAATTQLAATPHADVMNFRRLSSPDERHAQAVQSFREQRYAAAYGRFAALADAGHLPSAQVALVMYAQGGALFGSAWSATPDQRRRWSTLVINAARQRVELPDNERHD